MKTILILVLFAAALGITLYFLRSKPEPEPKSLPDSSQVKSPSEVVHRTDQNIRNAFHRVGPDEKYPRIDLNPGWPNPDITQANIADTICIRDWKTSSIRPPASYTTRLKRSQIVEYGFADTNTADYEEDHIISLEDGGDPKDPRNLYPAAYNTEVNGQRVGAHEKDAVENYAHNGICLDIPDAKFTSGPKPKHPLTLEQGQQILARDWYGCFERM